MLINDLHWMKDCYRSFQTLLEYKTEQCALKEECRSKRCPYYHSGDERRRVPFSTVTKCEFVAGKSPLELLKHSLNSSEALKANYSEIFAPLFCGEEGCLNVCEFEFHPVRFKSERCLNTNCENINCAFFHSTEEREGFAELRAALSPSSHPLARLNEATHISQQILKNICVVPSSNKPNELENKSLFSHCPYVRQTFVLEEELQGFECINLEFKHFARLELSTALDYICGFLNTFGGTLLFGVNDSGVVRGIQLSRKEIDHFQINMDIALRNFTPSVLPEQVILKFHPLSMKEAGPQPSSTKYVVQIDVAPPPRDHFYLTDRQEFFIKKNGSLNKLSIAEIIALVRFRTLSSSGLTPQEINQMPHSERVFYKNFLQRRIDLLIS